MYIRVLFFSNFIFTSHCGNMFLYNIVIFSVQKKKKKKKEMELLL